MSMQSTADSTTQDRKMAQMSMMRMSKEAMAMPWPGRGAFVTEERS